MARALSELSDLSCVFLELEDNLLDARAAEEDELVDSSSASSSSSPYF